MNGRIIRPALAGLCVLKLIVLVGCPSPTDSTNPSTPSYSVIYSGNGNTSGNVPVDNTKYSQGEFVTVLGNTGNLVRTGYSFSGWNTAANGSGTTYAGGASYTMEATSITLYAQWTANSDAITFDATGGTTVSSISSFPVSSVPISSKTSSALEGWYSDPGFSQASKISFPYTPSGSITLYAKWIPSTEGLSFSLSGAGYSAKGSSGLSGTLTIPEYWLGLPVTSIGDKAFQGYNGLSGSLIIPDSVTSIGNYAFSLCSGFSGGLTIPSNVTTIGTYAFNSCTHLTGSLTIPDSVTSIGNYAFKGCIGLNGSPSIPSGVTSIAAGVFSGCTGFTDFAIPNTVNSIGSYAFYGCTGLADSFTIPSSVTSIGSYSFYDCPNLTSVIINALSPPTLTSNSQAFGGTTTAQIKVPTGPQTGETYVDLYKRTTGWIMYASRISSQ